VNNNHADPKELKEVMDKEQLNWRSFADPGEIYARWSASGSPTFYVIDSTGVIRHRWSGHPGPGPEAIDAAIGRLLDEATATE
jgi:hypothetical protein